MNGVEVSEDLNDWEQVQSPFTQIELSSSSTIQSREWEITAIRDNYYLRDDCSVFPPSHHEGLRITSEDTQVETHQVPISPSSSATSLSEERRPESDSRMWVSGEIGRRLRMRFQLLNSMVLRMAYHVRSRVVFGKGFWSIASASGVMVVVALSLLYMKMQRWRRRVQEENRDYLVLLLKERDKKINQLLFQIAQMNELLSARRRVPVIHVG